MDAADDVAGVDVFEVQLHRMAFEMLLDALFQIEADVLESDVAGLVGAAAILGLDVFLACPFGNDNHGVAACL